MKDYKIPEQEVYYYHVESGCVVSRTQLNEFREKGDRYLSYFYCRPMDAPVQAPLTEMETKKYTFNIYDIPFSDEWEVFVRQSNTLTRRDLHAIISSMDNSLCQNPVQENARKKLLNELERIDKRLFYNNVEIPNF